MNRVVRSVTRKLHETPDLLALASEGPSIVWFTEATSLVASGPFLRIYPGTGTDRFADGSRMFHAAIENAEIDDEVDVPGTGPMVCGSWTFDPAAPGSLLMIPSTVHGAGEGICWRTDISFAANPLEEAAAPKAAGGTDSSETDWMEIVCTARAQISAGNFDKAVLARQVTISAPSPLDGVAITGLLHSAYPGCFVFLFENLVGASPELLIRRVGDVVDSIPLAGSAPRGETPNKDLILGRRLRESAKNRSEHDLTVNSVMDGLNPHCAELVAEAEPSLLLLANLQHLSTKVQGRLSGTTDALELVGALHPTAAVCGVPRLQAIEFIRNAESFERGRYAGPIGWMDHHGDGEWALALRCALLDGNTARVFAGAGIVADSDPEEELQETRLKLQAMLDVLEP